MGDSGGSQGSGDTILGPASPDGHAIPALAGRPADALTEGLRVGEYVVERLLGEGGMGQVYGGRQPLIGKRVAIKVLKSAVSGDPELVRRFVDEARAVNEIGHPNIIDIFSFGRLPDGRQYFVMELLEGETLGARMARGPLPVAEARRLLLQACQALEAAHQEGIVHRDLKPDNVWVAQPKHGDPFIKLLDFGIAKLIETERVSVTESGVAIGTAQYMSPEQCKGQGVNHRTDIYALGAILYELFTGRLPFPGESFAEVVAQQLTAAPPPPSSLRPMSSQLEALILECLAKDPEQRPQTTGALGRRLDEVLAADGQPTMAIGGAAGHASADTVLASGAKDEAVAVPPPPRTGLRRTLLAAGALGAAAAAVGLAVMLALRGQGPSAPASTPAAAPAATPAARPDAAPDGEVAPTAPDAARTEPAVAPPDAALPGAPLHPGAAKGKAKGPPRARERPTGGARPKIEENPY